MRAFKTKNKPIRIVVILFAIILALLLLFSCGKKTDPGDGRKTAQVRAAAATAKPFHDELSSFGTVTYKIKNDITAQVEGIITELRVREGDEVRMGQEIALLKNVQLEIQREQYENALDSAKAGLFMARTRLEEGRLGVESRLLSIDKNQLALKQQEMEMTEARSALENRKALLDIGGITDSAYRSLELSVSSKEAEIGILKKDIEIARLGLRDTDLIAAGFTPSEDSETRKQQFIELNTRSAAAEFETAEANLRNAEKTLDSANRLIEELSIRSSVAGVVGALYFETGEYVPRNEKIATIMDISRVYALFYIQEQDISSFARGAPLGIEIPSLKKNLSAGIDEISPMADPQSGNFSVKAEIPNRDLNIKPGMFIKCRIPRSQEMSFPVVPETVLARTRGNEGELYCVINGIAVLKTVTVQAKKNGELWISSGLNEGDVVIDKPSPFLKEGEYVEYR
ncbi:hemolysin D [Spirochaetia bacterium]|nr:hemolysin D [Spirochaetia bacterium]